MDVSVSVFRAEMAHWLAQVKDGDIVTITEHGVPVAQLSPIETNRLLEDLTRQGVMSKPVSLDRPRAEKSRRIVAKELVSELIEQQRR